MKKAYHDPIRRDKCVKLQKEFLELYERAKIKEKDVEGKAKNKTQGPLYCIIFPDKRDENIFRGFRYASYRTAYEYRKNNEVSKSKGN